MITNIWLFSLGVVLLAVGVGAWGWFVRRWLERRRQLRTWPRTTARFTEARRTRETVHVEPTSRTFTIAHGSYTFTDGSGRVRVGKHRAAPSKLAGNRLEVMYDPGDSARHEPVMKRPLWAGLLTVVPVSLPALSSGLVCLLLGLGYA